MKKLLKNIRYYFWATNKRRILDKIQEKYRDVFHGIVLDIGGRDRGKFKKPKAEVEKWIFADIEEKFKPDIVLDVANMKFFEDNSVDVINANELFEHVEKIDKGPEECRRILKPDGIAIISVPFLKEIHADPHDFQRWTEIKWKNKFKELGFDIRETVILGRFFCTLVDMIKVLIKKLPLLIRLPIQAVSYPFLDALVWLDNTSFVLNDNRLKNFHVGYFFILKNKK